MSSQITLNTEQSLYVIPCGGGYSCFGFENAKRDTEQIALALDRKDLMPTPEVFGKLAGYSLYEKAVQAWGNSILSRKTWFYPGTVPKVQSVLESFRESNKLIRLFYGDPETGKDSCEEWDVVGRIGRSSRMMKIPLLIPQGEHGGGSILSNRVLRIMDVTQNKDIYRHPKYQVPAIRLEQITDPKHPEYCWAGYRDDSLVARFKTPYEAAEWDEFITGRIASKREEILTRLKLAA